MHEFSVPPVATIGDPRRTSPIRSGTTPPRRPTAVQFARRRRRRPTGGRHLRRSSATRCVRLASGLIAAGVQAGDRVGLMSKTRYEWTLVDYAIWAAGAVTVPIYETSSAEQVAWILSDSGAVACFVETPAHAGDRRRGPRPAGRACATVWQIDGGELDAARGARRRHDPTREVDQRRTAVRADDLATIIYTSGTTGRPKGCVLTHRNMYSDIANAIPGLPNLFHEGASHAAVPAAGALVRPADPDRRGAGPRHARAHTAGRQEPGRRPGRRSGPRSCSPYPGCSRRSTTPPAAGARRRQGRRSSTAPSGSRSPTARRWTPRAGPASACACSTRSSTGWSTASSAPRSAAAARRRSPAAHRSAPGSAHFFRGIGVTIYEGYGLTETSPAAAVNLAARHPDRHRRPAAARRHRSASPTTARS